MATEPTDVRAELEEAYRRFDKAHKAGDFKSAKELRGYALQLEEIAKQGSFEPEPEPESKPALETVEPQQAGVLSTLGQKARDYKQSLKIGVVNIAGNYLSGRERERQQRQKAADLIKSKLPEEWKKDPALARIVRSDDVAALDMAARERFGDKYDAAIGDLQKDPATAKLIDNAKSSDVVNFYDNIIRPYFSKDGPDLSQNMEGLVTKMREAMSPEAQASSAKPFTAENAEFFSPGSWFDETTKAPWHDFDGFMLTVMENSPQIGLSIAAARGGGAIGARLGLRAVGGTAAAPRLDAVRTAINRGASIGGMTAGAATEGILIRDQVGKEVYDRTMELDDATWKTSDEYHKLRDAGLSDTEAKQVVSTETSIKAGNTAMVVSGFMAGAPAGHFFGKLAGAQGSRSFVNNVVKGALVEGAQEGTQEGIEQTITNLGVRRVDPTQPIFEGLGEAMVGGAFVSAPIGALGGMTGARKGPGLTKEQQDVIDATQPWEKAADARWKLQNQISDEDDGRRSPEERLGQISKLEDAQKKEAEAFLKAEPMLRRHMISQGRPDEEIKRLDKLKASANAMISQIGKAKENRSDAQKDVKIAREMMAERQQIVEAVEQDVLKRDEMERLVTNMETVRNKGALDQEGYDELEREGYGRFSDDKSRFLLKHKGIRALKELKQQLELTKARISGEYAGEERRSDTRLRKRMENMTPEQFEAAVYQDPTTGTLSRRAFDEAEKSEAKPAAYAEVDVDSLKWVNDNMSTEMGDRMLGVVADALKAQEGVKVYRVGGDEFVVTGESEEQVEQAVRQAKLDIDDIQPLTEGDETITPQITWATGTSRDAASRKTKKQKDERERKGKRAKRGEKPSSHRDLKQALLLHRDLGPLEKLARDVDEHGKSLSDYAAMADQIVAGQKKRTVKERIADLERDVGRPLTDRERDNLTNLFSAGNRGVLLHLDQGETKGHSRIDRGPGGFYKFSDLPQDMRGEIDDHVTNQDGQTISMTAELPLLEIPIELFPQRKANKNRTLPKDVALSVLPPVVIAKKHGAEGYWFIDGMHRYERARELGVSTLRAVDVGQWITKSVGHGEIKMPPIKSSGDRSKARHGDLHINDIEGGYPSATDTVPGRFPSNGLVVPKDLYNQINPEDLEFVLDGNGNLAIPSYIAGDIYDHLMKENGVEDDAAVVAAVRMLEDAKLKKKSIEVMRKYDRGTVSVRTFNAMLTGIHMAANGLTEATARGTPAIRISPMYELEPTSRKEKHRAQARGNITPDTMDDLGYPTLPEDAWFTDMKKRYSSYASTSTYTTYAIGDQQADLLRDKELVCIWCNADQFSGHNKLAGFFTGMFVSEVSEANMMGLKGVTQADVDESNYIFSEVAGEHIGKTTEAMYDAVIAGYADLGSKNPVVKYNIEQIEKGRKTASEHPNPQATGNPKTLVIHPTDKSTDFLKPIYAGHPEWTVMTDGTTEDVSTQIALHDRVIMLGHGSPGGLLSVGKFSKKPSAVEDSTASAYRDSIRSTYGGGKGKPHMRWDFDSQSWVEDSKPLRSWQEQSEIDFDLRVQKLKYRQSKGTPESARYPPPKPYKPWYRRANATEMQEAKAVLQMMLAEYHNLPPITLHASIEDLPYQQFATVMDQSGGNPSGVRGFFDEVSHPVSTGLHIIIGHLPSHKTMVHGIAETVFHELVGHYGLRGLMGNSKDLDLITKQLREAFPDRANKMAGMLIKQGETIADVWADPERASIAGEEIFAYEAGDYLSKNMSVKQRGVFKRAFDMLRDWLRKHGFGRWIAIDGKQAERDLLRMIERSADYVRNGGHWAFVNRRGERQTMFMRDAEMFKSGVVTAIQEGMRKVPKNERKKDGPTEVPLFPDVGSINSYSEAFKRGVAEGLYTQKELDETGILDALKTSYNPVKWLMGEMLQQTAEELSTNAEIPLADIEKLLDGEPMPAKYADKLLNYARTPGVLIGAAANAGFADEQAFRALPHVANRLTSEVFQSGTIMNYRQLAELINKDTLTSRQTNLNANIIPVGAELIDDAKKLLSPQHAARAEREAERYAKELAEWEKEREKAAAQHRTRPTPPSQWNPADEVIDPKSPILTKELLSRIANGATIPNVIPWQNQVDYSLANAYFAITGQSRSISELSQVPVEIRAAVEEEYSRMRLLGPDLGMLPGVTGDSPRDAQRWFDGSTLMRNNQYENYSPFGTTSNYREVAFYQIGRRNYGGGGHSFNVGRSATNQALSAARGHHMSHLRHGLSADAAATPPTAPNPKMQGWATHIVESQSDTFQRTTAGFANDAELQAASARFRSLQPALRNAINASILRMVQRIQENMLYQNGAGMTAAMQIASADLVEVNNQLTAMHGTSRNDPRVFYRNALAVKQRVLDKVNETLRRMNNEIQLQVSGRSQAGATIDPERLKRSATLIFQEMASHISYGAGDAAQPITQFYDHLPEIAKTMNKVYAALNIDPDDSSAFMNDMVIPMPEGEEMFSGTFRFVAGTAPGSDTHLRFIWNTMSITSQMEAALTESSFRSTPYASFVSVNSESEYLYDYHGPKAQFKDTIAALKTGLKEQVSKEYKRVKINESARLDDLDTYPTMERLTEWLGLVEHTDDATLDRFSIKTQSEYIEANISDEMDNFDSDDYTLMYNGHELNEQHPDYRELVTEDEDGDLDEAAADAWLSTRRRAASRELREEDGAIYNDAHARLVERYAELGPKVQLGQLPISEDETVPFAVITDEEGDSYIKINGEDKEVPGHGTWFRRDHARSIVNTIRQYYITEDKDAIDTPFGPSRPETTAGAKLDAEAKAASEKFLALFHEQAGEASTTPPPKEIAKALRELTAKISDGIAANSPFEDPQWRIIHLRYLIADAVRRGIPKIQYLGGEASTARGGLSTDWVAVDRITWSMETFQFGDKPKEYMVVRAPQLTHPLILTTETAIPTLGKDAVEYIEQQKRGEKPRSAASDVSTPSRADLLISNVADTRVPGGYLYWITRVGSTDILHVEQSPEAIEREADRLVAEAVARGGWASGTPARASGTTTPANYAVLPENLRVTPRELPAGIKQWGEVTAFNIGGAIQIVAEYMSQDHFVRTDTKHTKIYGARMAYDSINRRLWNKELKKYGAEFKTGLMYVHNLDPQSALQRQGMHLATDISPAIIAQYGEPSIVPAMGEQRGFIIMGKDGPLTRTLYRTREEAEGGLRAWMASAVPPTERDRIRVKVWEVEINDKMREVFSKPVTPFMRDIEHDPILKEASNKIGSHGGPSLRDRYQSWRSMWKDNFTQGAIDRFYGIRRSMKEAGLAELEAELNPYVQARLTTSLDAVMRAVMEYGHPVWREGMVQTEGRGLVKILQPVANHIDLWTMYMAGVRAKRLYAEGREKTFTPEMIERMVSLGETFPVFERVAKEYAAFNKRVLDFAEQAGVINAETRPMWENADYIPFYRVQDDRIVGPMSGGAGIANQKSPIKKLKGSQENVGDLMHNIMMNLTKLVDGSMKNHAALMAVDALRPHGIISNQPMAWSEQLIPMEQVKKALIERGIDVSTIPEEALKGFQKMFAMQAPKGEGIISVLRNGKKEFYYTDDVLLYRAMTSINKKHFGPLMNLLRAPKRLLTTWITLDPGFMAANFLRDALSSFVLSRDTVVPLAGGLAGFVRALAVSEEMRTMLSAGAAFENGYIDQYDPNSTKRLLRRSFKTHNATDVMLDSPAKLYRLWKRIGSATENANRIAVYRAAIGNGKSKAQAVFEAKDLMDFSMAGDWPVIQFLVQTVPFLGARIQGLHRLGRGFRENPVAFTLKGALVGIAGLALWMMYRDDERYKELEDWDKDTYFHFWIGENHYRLPKPFEVGAIFNTIPERIFEYIYSKENDAGKQLLRRWGWMLGNTFNMNPIPQAIHPMVEGWFNYNFFTGNQIESPYEEERLPPERNRVSTSPTMVELARMLPAGLDTVSEKIRSPLQLQNLYAGYTGTLGKYFMMGADALIRESMDLPEPPSLRKADYPVLGRFSLGSEPRRTRYEEEFYNTLRRAVQVQGSVKFLEDATEDERLAYVEGKYDPYIAVSRDLENARQEVSGINKEMREIYLDPKMSRDKKREQIDQLQIEKNQVFKEAYELRPGGKENQTVGRISIEDTRFFIEQFNSDKISPDLAKAAPATAELLTDIRGLSKRNVQALAKAIAE